MLGQGLQIEDALEGLRGLRGRMVGERAHGPATEPGQPVEGVNLGVLRTDVHQAFGHWRGWVVDGDGLRHSVDGLVGWAEQADNKW